MHTSSTHPNVCICIHLDELNYIYHFSAHVCKKIVMLEKDAATGWQSRLIKTSHPAQNPELEYSYFRNIPIVTHS